jgi:pimeloyl-ACP methyl ester carboxylesterase
VSVVGVARHAGAHLMVVSPPRRRPPGSPDFYLPPDPLPELEPGEIIRAEPMDAYLVPGIRLRAHAWRVMYRSTGAVGESTAVTGTVLLPLGRRRVRPLIGFAIGTHGIGDMAAPSRLLSAGHDWEAGLMAMVLARGYAVAVTDYQGLGTPGDHAYMVGQALGRNVLDVMRAARSLDYECLPVDGPAAVIGYSEGGFAAAWAAQLQPAYAPEMDLAGVAAGAAAADMEVAGPRLSGSFFSFFMAYGGIGYAAAYPELELEPYLTARARDGIEALRRSTVLQAVIKGPHFMHAADLTQPNVLEMPEWRVRLQENRLGGIAPAAPVLLHHARQDQIVSFGQSQQLLEDWQGLGTDVRLYITRGGVDHISGAVAGTPVALEWLARRLERGAAPGNPADVSPVPVTVVGEAA